MPRLHPIRNRIPSLTSFALSVAALLAAGALFGQNAPAQSPVPAAVSPDDVKEAVQSVADILRNGYVFPEVGEKMAADVLARLEKGEYKSITDEKALAEQLTKDLRAISKDKHLGVIFRPVDPSASTPMRGPSIQEMREHNYGFVKVEQLQHNIGYLRFDVFVPDDEAKQTASAALAFLQHSDALIIDLRHNGGGSPDMIRYITSYFFDSPTLLNRMLDRNGNVVDEYYTLETVPGKRFANDLPIYVLTSNRTFSGAEEFSYNLKNLKRATIIGEITGGGAHPVRGERASDRFVVRVPHMRAQNPISKTNWEGTGVEPDIKTSADEALDRAINEAKQSIGKRKPHLVMEDDE
jgi:retinol-binding protein 3